MRVKESDRATVADWATQASSAHSLMDRRGDGAISAEDLIQLTVTATAYKSRVLELEKKLNALLEYLDVAYVPERSEPVKGKVVRNESS